MGRAPALRSRSLHRQGGATQQGRHLISMSSILKLMHFVGSLSKRLNVYGASLCLLHALCTGEQDLTISSRSANALMEARPGAIVHGNESSRTFTMRMCTAKLFLGILSAVVSIPNQSITAHTYVLTLFEDLHSSLQTSFPTPLPGGVLPFYLHVPSQARRRPVSVCDTLSRDQMLQCHDLYGATTPYSATSTIRYCLPVSFCSWRDKPTSPAMSRTPCAC